ncbi:MAG: hypothetical protein Q4G30_06330 [Actinomycetaceae bacterium]|nr:hypothetical protein [Actinomycetaceae bacterium]
MSSFRLIMGQIAIPPFGPEGEDRGIGTALDAITSNLGFKTV